MIDFGLDPQQAAENAALDLELARPIRQLAHDGDDALTIERRFPEAVRAELARSFAATRRPAWLLAGSDPRRDGWALAW